MFRHNFYEKDEKLFQLHSKMEVVKKSIRNEKQRIASLL